MRTLFKLAWRNIWRNKRRTIITAASILFAVLLAAFMQSIQKGAWDRMVDNVVNFYFGYVQIHSKGYWEEQSLEKAFPMESALSDLPLQVPQIQALVPRLESFALAAHGEKTTGILVVGTDPLAEDNMTGLRKKLIEGNYFGADEDAVLLAQGAAENLQIKTGDTLVLISQGYHGANAAGKYVVKGIVKFGSPELNKQMVYLPLQTAQHFFGAPGLLTSLAVKIGEKQEASVAIDRLREKLDTAQTYEVMGWEELMPELVEAREVDTAGNVIVLLILYVIIAFGIFGTILMMTKERSYEFGVLLAIGMKRHSMGFMVWLETVFLGLLGAVAGMIASLPLIYYFYVHPIDFGKFSKDMATAYEKFGFEPIFPAALDAGIFLQQALVVLAITSVMAIYPLIKIKTLRPVEAMRA